jgi:hypothetical protein
VLPRPALPASPASITRFAVLFLFALASLLVSACAPVGRPGGTLVGNPAPAPAAAAKPDALPLSLLWASMEYFQAGPADPVVEMRIIVGNHGLHTTESTTILWDADFQQRFGFLRSDPPAWRVHVDEQGRGVMDTSGTIPGQYSTFHLWFVASEQAVREPNVLVVANGSFVVADTVATATFLRSQGVPSTQQLFASGPLASIADRLRFIPDNQYTSLGVAALMGLAICVTAAGGGCAAYWLTALRHHPLS